MWYLVMSKTINRVPLDHPDFRTHLDWLEQAHRDGKVLFSGPSEDRAFGIYIIVADNLEEATQIANEDVHHQTGSRKLQIIPWDIKYVGKNGTFEGVSTPSG